MSCGKLSYVIVDVFAAERFKGNQLAVVKVETEPLSHEQMQTIAREFGFSETVFLYAADQDGSFRINIFTPVSEMAFAGHPVIGTGHVLFLKLFPGLFGETSVPKRLTLLTKAGPVLVAYNEETRVVSAEVPHSVHLHSRETPKLNIVGTQPNLASTESAMQDGYPTMSIVKGVTYTLVDFTGNPELFAAVGASRSQVAELDDGWTPSFMGVMYYQRLGTSVEQDTRVQHLRVRMIAEDIEDAACGSGSCSLAAYLALQDGEASGKYRCRIDQGQEIRRDSEIVVDVTLNKQGSGIETMYLAGPAVHVAEGTIIVPE